MEYKVSVIVPMYKAARFIKATVDGLLDQTLKELEVILVDDCSPDDTLEICRTLYGNHERVQILSQPRNMGPGEARNTGMRAARGEYTAFVDCDDAVLKNAYEEMYNLAKEKSDADVVHCTGMILPLDKRDPDSLYEVDEKDYFYITSDRYKVPKEVTVLPDDIGERYDIWRHHGIQWTVGTKLFRTQFLREQDLCFGEIRLSEDMAFCFAALFFAKTFVITPKKYYLYRISNESISRRGYTTQFFKMALHALFNVCPLARKTMDRVEYFKQHPESERGVLEYMIEVLEQEFVIPVYQSLKEEEILKDGVFTDFMKEQFGENADYVTCSFLEQHRKYPPTVSSVSLLTIDNMIKYRAKVEAAAKERKE